MEAGEFADVSTNVFAWYLRLLEEAIQEKDLTTMEDFWQKSQTLGTRGVVMRDLINQGTRPLLEPHRNKWIPDCLWPKEKPDPEDNFMCFLNIKRFQHLQTLLRTKSYQELLEVVKDYHYAFIFSEVSFYRNERRADLAENRGLYLCAYLRSLGVLKENSSARIKHMLEYFACQAEKGQSRYNYISKVFKPLVKMVEEEGGIGMGKCLINSLQTENYLHEYLHLFLDQLSPKTKRLF